MCDLVLGGVGDLGNQETGDRKRCWSGAITANPNKVRRDPAGEAYSKNDADLKTNESPVIKQAPSLGEFSSFINLRGGPKDGIGRLIVAL